MSSIIMNSKTMDIPIIQGGMGVGISLSKLAGNVAKCGGMGVISAVNPGYKNKDFISNPVNINMSELKKQIRDAKEISEGRGIVAVNVMCAINNYELTVKTAVEGGADAIVCGAGMPLKLPELVNKDTLIAPIVSSKRALSIIIRTWLKRYNRICDFVIVEGPLAGGHLGFKKDEIEKVSLDEILEEVFEYVKELEEKYNEKIYIFAAGGIRNAKRRFELMEKGADGIQVATPFIATVECDADENFKNEIINSTDEDIVIINSPVGMPARAINNNFVKDIKENKEKIARCLNCLKTCDPRTTEYCIGKALGQSAKGRQGLVFSGSNINNITKITSVKDVINSLMEEL